jgi:hypothetical protein
MTRGRDESANKSFYKDGRGCRNVPLLPIIQRFLDVMTTLMSIITVTQRGCMQPNIEPDQIEYFDKLGIHCSNGYIAIKCCSTRIGLHAMYWIFIHRRHPFPGKQCRNSSG